MSYRCSIEIEKVMWNITDVQSWWCIQRARWWL